eukprot:COSAG01_NODE_1734_length_9366_cov_4.124636_9_plen_69_part_00
MSEFLLLDLRATLRCALVRSTRSSIQLGSSVPVARLLKAGVPPPAPTEAGRELSTSGSGDVLSSDRGP